MALVIGLAGLGGSGKSEVSAYLATKGFARFGFSDVLREEAQRLGLLEGLPYEQQKYVFSQLGEKKRRESGMGVMAQLVIERIGDADKVVADGFLSPEEVLAFRSKYGKGFILIHVNASDEVRFLRRKSEDPKADRESFMKRSKENIDFMGAGKVLKMVNYRITNNGTKADLYRQVDEFLRQIGCRL